MHMGIHKLLLSNIILMLKHVSIFFPHFQRYQYGLFLLYPQRSSFHPNPLPDSSSFSFFPPFSVFTDFSSPL